MHIGDCVQVRLVEVSKQSLSLPQILFRMMTSAMGLNHLKDGLISSDEVQARMDDGIMFQGSEGSSLAVADPIFNLLKDYLNFV